MILQLFNAETFIPIYVSIVKDGHKLVDCHFFVSLRFRFC